MIYQKVKLEVEKIYIKKPMENKQTAVEWLENMLPNIDFKYDPYYRDLLNQAKAMEREQMVRAFNAGQASTATEPFWTKGDYYYEQKYGKRNAPISEGIDQPGLPDGME